MNHLSWHLTLSLLSFVTVWLLVYHGYAVARYRLHQRREDFDRVLNQQLLLNISPTLAVGCSLILIAVGMLVGYGVTENSIGLCLGAVAGGYFPPLILKYLQEKRIARLEEQLVDGIVTLSSGVRAGLNFGQAFELLVKNSVGPIRQEFGQLIREYQMGLDFNHAMRNTADRIGLRNYRLLFTALEMHRQRGGNAADSLDRIAESIREIQRLEGKLDALTSQGRTQAWMMAVMPVVFLFMMLGIDPESTRMLFVEPMGRMLLLFALGLIVVAFFWIQKIMAIDI